MTRCTKCGYLPSGGEFDGDVPKTACPSCGADYVSNHNAEPVIERKVDAPPENRAMTKAPETRGGAKR